MTEKMKEMFINLYVEKYGCKINEELARDLVDNLPVLDGSQRNSGEVFSYEESIALANSAGVNLSSVSPWEWYLVINSYYAEHFQTINKYKITDKHIYADLAKDWFYDLTSDESKTFRYFFK